jgi:hypothetical protein
MADSRNKGASFEREVAKLLVLELGIILQTRSPPVPDQRPRRSDPQRPSLSFELELKRYAKGPISGTDKWWQQVTTAAARTHKRPALIYKYDRQPIRVVVELQGIRCNISFEDFCYLAREIMAHDANF